MKAAPSAVCPLALCDTLPRMPSARARASSQMPLGRRLWGLIIGRAATAVLLLLSAIAWRSSVQAFSAIKSNLAPVIITVAGLTLLFILARMSWKNYLAQARLQILFDVLLAT